MDHEPIPEEPRALPLQRPSGRRTFLKWTGGAAAAALLAACDESPITAEAAADGRTGNRNRGPVTNGADAVTLDFSSDIGVLNYAYALEQLEAAFYILVTDNFYSGGRQEERDVLNDLRKHEIIHREFFRTALGDAAIPDLAFDFSSINTRARGRVLQLAQDFEDIGVSAYNGAAKLIEDTEYLVVAGKIVSVEARHASAIADLRTPNGSAFAPRAFDLARDPREVLALAAPFVATQINVVNLPA